MKRTVATINSKNTEEILKILEKIENCLRGLPVDATDIEMSVTISKKSLDSDLSYTTRKKP